MATVEQVEAIARDWARFMDIDTPFTVQVGTFENVPSSTGEEWGCTIGSPDNTEFIVAVHPDTPPEKLERVVVHELVHVATFRQSGDDDRLAMEIATELAAGLVMTLREYEEPDRQAKPEPAGEAPKA